MQLTLPQGMTINAPITAEYASILTPAALTFVADLHRQFETRRADLMAQRVKRQAQLDAGHLPDFLPETADIRAGDWRVAAQPADLLNRQVEITGPVERKMMINAFNSGANSFMVDFEDSNCPNWHNQIQGQINVKAAYRRELTYTSETGKYYEMNAEVATLNIRPRGWHLMESHVLVDGQPVSGALFDFGLAFFHNMAYAQSQGSATYFYLPKLESHLEARLWNDVFVFAQHALGIAQGTIKATVLIETILAAFEMEEILYELRDHSAGLNAGRWDYLFSCIKKFKANKDFCLANRSALTMTVPFMRAYALLLLKTCHKRGAPAIGGMSALIPIKNDEAANEKAMAGIRADKERDASDGYDGGWVAHPGLVPIAKKAFFDVLGNRPNQYEKTREDVQVVAADLLNFVPEQPITEAGLRMNIDVGIQYLGAWLSGNGCVPIHNLMEDAATAEISRSQVWQWLRSDKGVLDDGRAVDVALVTQLHHEVSLALKAQYGTRWTAAYEAAAALFLKLALDDAFVEFLTLPAYDYITERETASV